jgi:hypothetical protein
MKQGQQDVGFVHDEQGVLLAVSLGWQTAAEHETGIKSMRDAFGIDDSKLGVEKRAITQLPREFAWFSGKRKIDKKNVTIAGFGTESVEYELMHAGFYRQPPGLYAAWDWENFVVGAIDKAMVSDLEELFEAFKALDVCIWRGGASANSPFGNAGLILGIKSRVPEQYAKQWEESDIAARQLREDVLATGIEAKLAKAGCRYFALSPRRQDDGSIRFWLNPMEQQKNNYGWYTLDDLEQWAEGKGPVVAPRKR